MGKVRWMDGGTDYGLRSTWLAGAACGSNPGVRPTLRYDLGCGALSTRPIIPSAQLELPVSDISLV